MQFLYPGVLFFLFAIAVPIIIHLFNFRTYKKVYFTNVRLIKEIKEEKKSKSHLKELLILISRILAVIFLVFGFSQPFIPANESAANFLKTKAISVYIDNSFSMDAIESEGSLLEKAKKKAQEISSAYGSADLFQLLTNDFEGRHQRLISKEDFLDLLTEVAVSPSVRTISDVVARQKDALNNNASNSQKDIFLLSDFQKSTSELNLLKSDTNFNLHLIPIQSDQQSNIFIDSVWFTSPIIQLNQLCEIIVKIKNSSSQKAENVSVQLYINEKQKALASCAVKANSSEQIKLSFQNSFAGWQKAEVIINDFPITFDNKYYLSYKIEPALPILCINGEAENKYLKAVYQSDAYFNLINVPEDNVNYASLVQYRLIILNELKSISSGLAHELTKFLEQGSSIIVIPNSKADIVSYNEFFLKINTNSIQGINEKEENISFINLQCELFKNVFEKIPENIHMPLIKNYYTFSGKTKTSLEKILGMPDGTPLLGKYSFKKGNIYVFAASFNSEYTTLPKHAIFVPLMYKIALYSSIKQTISYTIGTDKTLLVENTQLQENNLFRIVNNNLKSAIESKEKQLIDFEIIPEQRTINNKVNLLIHDQIKKSGHYDLFGEKKDTSNLLAAYSFNYSRTESDLSCLDISDIGKFADISNIKLIENTTNDLSLTINKINKGTQFWKVCITFALIFLAIEILLLKFF